MSPLPIWACTISAKNDKKKEVALGDFFFA